MFFQILVKSKFVILFFHNVSPKVIWSWEPFWSLLLYIDLVSFFMFVMFGFCLLCNMPNLYNKKGLFVLLFLLCCCFWDGSNRSCNYRNLFLTNIWPCAFGVVVCLFVLDLVGVLVPLTSCVPQVLLYLILLYLLVGIKFFYFAKGNWICFCLFDL